MYCSIISKCKKLIGLHDIIYMIFNVFFPMLEKKAVQINEAWLMKCIRVSTCFFNHFTE